jgi:magnesium transporter
VVVLSLFVPLCISTGGNSGSQAATLITRALALGQVSGRDWFRVLRHEVTMGVVLGLTLGGIGFVRASFTPSGVRSSSPPRNESFEVRSKARLQVGEQQRKSFLAYLWLARPETETSVVIPVGADQIISAPRDVTIVLPEGQKLDKPTREKDGTFVYSFPEKCTIRQDPVNRWDLALVIGLAVAGICLWGTLIGSMLPLVFRRLGADPGIASSPFVATFVDVTGIVIYFTIARSVLWQVLT